MSVWNGKRPPLRRIKRQGNSNNRDSGVQTMLLALPQSVRVLLLLMLLGLVLLLAACATPLSTPTEAATNPQAPQLSEPLPQEHYSKSAAERIKSWAERLMGM